MGCGCKKNKKKSVGVAESTSSFPTEEQRNDREYQKRVTEALRQYLEIKNSKRNLNRIK
tara:strand:+ start:1220 stop:1396 length:177 start_codon:yes stop_codon:yes gene_type:complete